MEKWTSKTYRKDEKIYRGAFLYFRNENNYAEENFDVYKDKKEQSLSYVSHALIKVTTGEVLNINVEYVVNKEFIPQVVMIQKTMGKESVREIYEYHLKKNLILYTFNNTKGDVHTSEINTTPKYHISTPTAASSMLFLRSKKIDANSKISFNSLISDNLWEFKEMPLFKNIIVERIGLVAEKMNIDGQNVQATQFKLFEEETDFKIKDPPHIKVSLSQLGAIPYLIRTDEGTKIQIKYLNNLIDKE